MLKEEIQLVKDSWNEVKKIADVAGPLFYNRLFEIAPEIRPMFRNSDLAEQSRKLFSMLNYVIAKLDVLDEIIAEVTKLAQRHVTYGVKESHYTQVGEALLWTLEKGLGENWTPLVKDAWVSCYTLLAGAMIDASKIGRL